MTAAPGERAEARIQLPLRAFQTWGADGWTDRPGNYRVRAGRSVADLPIGVVLEVPLQG